MPLPKLLIAGDGDRMTIDGNFRLSLTGHTDARLQAAMARFLQRLQMKTGIPMQPTSPPDIQAATLEIQCKGPGEPVQSMKADESYAIEVKAQNARLVAASAVGVLRGLETFLQLVELDNQSFYVSAPMKIEDSPRFPWRGLSVDVSRHWEPVDVIKRILDGMSLVKLNVFHWHLSDDQGFRVESRLFPKLHQKGSDGKYYRQSEIKEIVAYAHARGIRVVPEFDMPGHTTAWLVAYPELAAAPGPYQIERGWGVFDPCMDPTNAGVYTFLDAFIGEMAALFPDRYFHIGGDEVNGKQWNASKRIRDFKTRRQMKNNRDLQNYFNRQLLQILKKHGKRMIGWDEILHPDLPKDIAVQSWRGQASLAEGARQGYQGILSYGYYLDHMRPASFHYQMDPWGKEAAGLAEELQQNIIGGEACMWAEFVNPDNIESRLWPRAAAIAERLWSPGTIQSTEDMYRRLECVDRELAVLGSMHRNNYDQMLQRMAGDRSLPPLKKLAGLLKATSLSVRQRTRKYYSYTPMNRLADVVLPESKAARHFETLAANALKSPELIQNVKNQLELWKENRSRIKPIIDQSYLLQEAAPLSEMLSDLSQKGLEALDYIRSKTVAPQAWQKEASALLDRADKPQAEVLVAIAPAIRMLVEAAAGTGAR